MKKLSYLIILVFIGCSSAKIMTIDYTVLNCHVIDIKEYQYCFIFRAFSKGCDTILIISLKEDYHNKYLYKKPVLNCSQEIKLNQKYDFYLVQKRVHVDVMEQLGAFMIIGNDTLWKSSTFKDIPLFMSSFNTLGKYHNNRPFYPQRKRR